MFDLCAQRLTLCGTNLGEESSNRVYIYIYSVSYEYNENIKYSSIYSMSRYNWDDM